MTTYTKITKPSGTGYTPSNVLGKEQYDQASIAYDDSATMYDGTPASYTNVAKPSFLAVVDSYSETNKNNYFDLGDPTGDAIYDSQSFTNSTTATLGSCEFYLSKIGSPTGNMTAYLYAHTGTYGTSSKPTGSALATSTSVDTAILTDSFALVNFTFPVDYTMVAGTKYVIVLGYSGGDASNHVAVGVDDSSPTHGGNAAFSADGSSWTLFSTVDCCFYIYKSVYTKITKAT